jgi:hypothetical protein
MRTIITGAVAACLLSLVGAADARAQVNVNAPPAGGVEVQAPGTTIVVPPGTGAAIRDSAPIRQENRIERRADRQAARANATDWRMVNHENRWWYYHPNNSWSYYQNNRWNAWQTPAARTFSTQPMPNRYQSGYRGMNNATAVPSDAAVAPVPGTATEPLINDNNPNPAAVNNPSPRP